MLISFFWILIFLLCRAHGAVLRKYGRPPCDPLKNVYYSEQVNLCLPCETCLVGYGKLSLQQSKINLAPVNGPNECLECRPCKNNTYSDTQSFHCKPCTICATFGHFEISPCSYSRDTVCTKNRPIKKDETQTGNTVVSTTKPGDETKTPEYGQHSNVTVIIVLCLFVLVLVIVFAFSYRRGTLPIPRLWCVNNGDETVGHNSVSRTESQGLDSAQATRQGTLYGSTPSFDNNAFDRIASANIMDTHVDADESSDDECKPLLPQNRRPVIVPRTRHLSYNVQETSTDYPVDKERKRRSSLSVLDEIFKKPYPLLSKQMSTETPSQGLFNKDNFTFFKPYNSKMAEKIKKWDAIHLRHRPNPKPKKYLTAYEFTKTLLQLNQNKRLGPVLKRIEAWQASQAGELDGRWMTYLAKQLAPGRKFRDVARHVGLDDGDIIIIQQDYKDDCREQSYRVLEKLRTTGRIKTVDDIINILKQLKENELANEISKEVLHRR